jgi:hypothetical protein
MKELSRSEVAEARHASLVFGHDLAVEQSRADA